MKTTREQAINDLYGSNFSKEQLDTIVKAFEPTTKNDLGVDCISRQALLDATVKKSSIWNHITNSEGDNLEAIVSKLPSVTPQEPCEDVISRKSIKQKLQEHHDFFVNAYGGFSNLPQNDKSRVDEITNCIAMVVNEPSVTPQHSSELEKNSKKLEKDFGELDCISKAMALDCVNWAYNLSDAYQKINDLSPVTPQPRKGHWMDCSNGWMCSECNRDNTYNTNYCPNCGCKMAESEEINGTR